MFLKLLDASADTIETHFALGALYRRRGEVERAIRIHQNLLARDELAPEHREQALLALAQDYLRAGVLDRAEGLFQKVAETPRLRASALGALRGVYERQHEWQQALGAYRQLARIKAAPPRLVAAHYLCELAALEIERGAIDAARTLLRQARRETAPFPRATLLRAQIADQQNDRELAIRLLRTALHECPELLADELPHLLALAGPEQRDALLSELVAQARESGAGDLKRLVFAAIAADLSAAAPLRGALESVFTQDATLNAVWQEGRGNEERVAREVGALLNHAERYRCAECGFAGTQLLLALSRVSVVADFRVLRARQTALKIRYDFADANSSIGKNLRISRSRPRHEILARDESEPQGNASDRRQAADSVCSGRSVVSGR